MNRLHRRIQCGLAAATLAMLPLTAAMAGPTLAITGPGRVAPGAPFTLQVAATELTDLYAFQFDISFDAGLFAATGAAEGAFLASGGGSTFFDSGVLDNTAGVISFVLSTLIGGEPGVSGSGVLASLDFQALGPALSSGTFQLVNVLALDSSFNVINVDVQGHGVAIPEPAALSLALVALAMLGCTGRRRPVTSGRPLPAAH